MGARGKLSADLTGREPVGVFPSPERWGRVKYGYYLWGTRPFATSDGRVCIVHHVVVYRVCVEIGGVVAAHFSPNRCWPGLPLFLEATAK